MEIVIIADGRWRGLTWTEEGHTLAVAVSLTTHPEIAHRVLMVKNPHQEGEFLSLDCLLQEGNDLPPVL